MGIYLQVKTYTWDITFFQNAFHNYGILTPSKWLLDVVWYSLFNNLKEHLIYKQSAFYVQCLFIV